MRKRLTAVVLVLVLANGALLGQAKPGGFARQLSMGAAQIDRVVVVNPFIILDPTWLLINPAYQMKYADYAWFNVAGGAISNYAGENTYGNQFGGVGFSFGKDLAVGAVLGYDPSATNTLWAPLNSFIARSARPAQNPAALLGTPRPIEVFEVLAAFGVGGMDVGVGVSYGWSNQNFKSTPAPPATNSSDGELSASMLAIRAGLSMDMGGGSSVEGAVALRLDKVTDKYTVGGTGNGTGTSGYSASTTEIEANIRAALKMSSRFTLVPYGAMRMGSVEPKEDAKLQGQTAMTYSYKGSLFAFSLGLGGELKVKNFYLAGGLSFSSRSQKEETNPNGTPPNNKTTTNTESFSAFPVFNLGAEYWVLDWFAARAGYYRAFASATQKTEVEGGASGEQTRLTGMSSISLAGYVPSANDENGLMSVGIGLKFGGFALDAMVSEQALRRGLGLIGAGDNINTFGYLNLSYCFE